MVPNSYSRMIAHTLLIGALSFSKGLLAEGVPVSQQPSSPQQSSVPAEASAQAIDKQSLPKAPPAAIAAQPAPVAVDSAGKEGRMRARFAIDRQLKQAHAAKERGDWTTAQTSMLDAARQLKLMGLENDQVKTLREMTLEPTEGKPEQAQQYVRAGQQALADFYYRRYLDIKPRDAQWLLEALGWANYAADDQLLKRFSARVPDKAHENIDERGKQRGLELKTDDALYQEFYLIRTGKPEQVTASLKTWPYPINTRHSQMGTSLLHIAVWHNKPDIVKALVEQYKADVNLGDNDKDTALDYANHLKLESLATYLKSKGGKSNSSKKNAQPAAVTPAKP